MRVRAFAKINLSLHVLGKRADGYHELRTIFQSIALHDTLTIRRVRGPLRLVCDDPACPSDRTNLVWRAAERVWKASGRSGAPRDVAIQLAKRIPVQAGLGGASSDAAAAIRALGALWRVDARRQREIGAALGADVPYFFEGGTVLGLERGDLLFPLIDEPAAIVVLVLPAFGVSTADAFAWFDNARSSVDPSTRSGSSRAESRDEASKGERTNDLEPVVAQRHPEIARIVAALRRQGAGHAAMTGSGSAVFGLFASRGDAARAAAAVRPLGHRTLVTRTLARSAYRRLAAN